VFKEAECEIMVACGDLNDDMRLHPGDMVFLPQNSLSKMKGFVIPRVTVGPTVRNRID